MKLLRQQIKRCFECPYYRTPHDDKIKLDWCYLEGRCIEYMCVIPIPDWYPLPDEEVLDGK